MLSRGESVSVGFWQVVQLFAPPANPAITPRSENSFYKFWKKYFWMSTMCTQILRF